jgi:hypothetical protein
MDVAAFLAGGIVVFLAFNVAWYYLVDRKRREEKH